MSFAVKPLSTYEENDSLEIIAPSDFKFFTIGKEETLDFISKILEGGEQLLPDGTRVKIDGNSVYVIDTDTWINPQYAMNTLISTRTGLAFIALQGYRAFLS